jgi:hypothetical protein
MRRGVRLTCRRARKEGKRKEKKEREKEGEERNGSRSGTKWSIHFFQSGAPSGAQRVRTGRRRRRKE